MEEYRTDSEKPTILWFSGIMIISVLCLIGSVLLKLTPEGALIMLAVGIITASIGISIFIIAILYPAVSDWLRKPKKYDDE